VISIIYWMLILLLPSMIVPEKEPTGEPSADPLGKHVPELFFIPLPMDLALHLWPFITLATHFFFTETKYSTKTARVWAPLCAVAFGLWYSAFQEWCAAYNKTFSYPFLNVAFPIRVMIYLGSIGIATGGFTVLNSLHRGTPVVPFMYNTSYTKRVETKSI